MSYEGPERRRFDLERAILTAEQHAVRGLERFDGPNASDVFAKTPLDKFGGGKRYPGEDFRLALGGIREELKLGLLPPKELEPATVSFADAAERLKGVINLQQKKMEAVSDHTRWGLVQALVDKGVISGADQYGALFDECKFTSGGLESIGPCHLPLFVPGGLTLSEMYRIIFDGFIVDCGCDISRFSQLKQIDPSRIPGLSCMYKYRCRDPRIDSAFHEGVRESKVYEPTTRVLFTPDDSHVRDCHVPGVKLIYDYFYRGTQFLDPASDCVRWRTQVESALKERLRRDGCSIDSLDLGTYRKELVTAHCEHPPDMHATWYPLFALNERSMLGFGIKTDHIGHVDGVRFRNLHFGGDYDGGPRLAIS